MEEQRAGLVVAVVQVEEVRDDFPRIQLPLEHLGLGRQRHRIEPREVFAGVGLLLDLQQDVVGGLVDLPRAQAGVIGDEDPLVHVQLCLHRRLAQSLVVHRHTALTDDVKVVVLQRTVDDADGFIVHIGACGQEEVTHGKLAEGEPGLPGHLLEELWRQIHADPGTIACAVCTHAAPVRDRAQGFVHLLDNIVREVTAFAGQKTDTAAGVILGKIEQADGLRSWHTCLQIASPC